jgi:3-hydroxypropanoate dehydrogenase
MTDPAPSLHAPLDDRALDQLFREARTHGKWQDRPVPDDKLEALYSLLKFGPTSGNCAPARFLFIRTAEGKARLKAALSPGNIEKTMNAPVVAVVAHDQDFYDKLSFLFPHAEVRGWYADNPALADTTAFRNGTLQGAYLILAARAVGLDAGPMSGFDNIKLDSLFFAGTRWKSNFLVNLGYGDPSGLYFRGPRLSFDEACRFE